MSAERADMATYPEVPEVTNRQFVPPHAVQFLRRPPATTGAIAELVACAELMRMGYHVYRCESPAAPFDLVAYRDGRCLRVEVKSMTEPREGRRERGGPNFSHPTNDEWDLLVIVGRIGVFMYQRGVPFDAIKQELRDAYGWTYLDRKGRNA